MISTVAVRGFWSYWFFSEQPVSKKQRFALSLPNDLYCWCPEVSGRTDSFSEQPVSKKQRFALSLPNDLYCWCPEVSGRTDSFSEEPVNNKKKRLAFSLLNNLSVGVHSFYLENQSTEQRLALSLPRSCSFLFWTTGQQNNVQPSPWKMICAVGVQRFLVILLLFLDSQSTTKKSTLSPLPAKWFLLLMFRSFWSSYFFF